jgi:hypothetical protein
LINQLGVANDLFTLGGKTNIVSKSIFKNIETTNKYYLFYMLIIYNVNIKTFFYTAKFKLIKIVICG